MFKNWYMLFYILERLMFWFLTVCAIIFVAMETFVFVVSVNA